MQEQMQLPQQISQPVHSDEIVANMVQEERVRNVISQTSPDNQLIEIEWRIKGYRRNEYGSWEKIDATVKEVNSKLVTRYISALSAILNDNTRYTNLTGWEIQKIMYRMIEWITDDLDDNAKDYDLEYDYTERTRIGNILLFNTFFVLKRAQNGMESRRIWHSLNMIETMSGGQERKGLWNKIKSMF